MRYTFIASPRKRSPTPRNTAAASQVSIELRRDGERGLLRVEDNGQGFNPALHHSKGLGLRIMHYRAQMMAGSLRIESTRSRGTVVSCWFPR